MSRLLRSSKSVAPSIGLANLPGKDLCTRQVVCRWYGGNTQRSTNCDVFAGFVIDLIATKIPGSPLTLALATLQALLWLFGALAVCSHRRIRPNNRHHAVVRLVRIV
jgi:hypothetical protein